MKLFRSIQLAFFVAVCLAIVACGKENASPSESESNPSQVDYCSLIIGKWLSVQGNAPAGYKETMEISSNTIVYELYYELMEENPRDHETRTYSYTISGDQLKAVNMDNGESNTLTIIKISNNELQWKLPNGRMAYYERM